MGGGVAANGELRRRLSELGAALHVPARVLCTDNAAMIASAARFGEPLAYPRYLALDAYATGERALRLLAAFRGRPAGSSLSSSATSSGPSAITWLPVSHSSSSASASACFLDGLAMLR